MNNYEQPIYRRQRYLLTFTGHLKDNGISRTNLQKLIFLSELYTGTAYYDFIPYKFGPYSLHMEKDIDTLCMKGFLKKSGRKIHVQRKIDFSISCSIVPERGGDLIRRVYREYPYYAVNSKILSEPFSREEAEDILHRGKIIQDDSRDIIFTIAFRHWALYPKRENSFDVLRERSSDVPQKYNQGIYHRLIRNEER